MNIKIFLIALVALMVGCQGFDFVYDKPPTIKLLENNTDVIVSGDDSSIIKSQLNNIIGKPKSNSDFELLIASTKTSKNIVIKDNQTASQIEIHHILNYILQEKQKNGENCIILETKISSNLVYNLKSSGYSFGTDSTKKESLSDNVEKNIDDFFKIVTHSYSDLVCKNED